MIKKPKLSVALATFNEEANIERCLAAVKDWVDEIVIVDGSSTDQTVVLAKKYGAKVIIRENPAIFHINKQIALEKCQGEWVLQLDADEEVSPKLAKEIAKIIKASQRQIKAHQAKLKDHRLFLKHQKLLDQRDGQIGKATGEYAGFFVPRLNYFLGKYLRYGGVYPDGVIRLIKNGQAHFPCKSVHEQIVVKGRVGWLDNSLFHHADPTFKRYLERNSRYINLIVDELKLGKTGRGPIKGLEYFFFKPIHWFLLTAVYHGGFLDGWRGLVFSFFSALRFPRAYWRYLLKR